MYILEGNEYLEGEFMGVLDLRGCTTYTTSKYMHLGQRKDGAKKKDEDREVGYRGMVVRRYLRVSSDQSSRESPS